MWQCLLRQLTNSFVSFRRIMDSFEKPVYDGQRYSNPKSFINWTGLPTFRDLFKWKCFEPSESVPSNEVLEDTLPVEKPKFDLSSKLSATYPVWSLRASPIRFFGPERYRPSPCTIAELPELNFGVILIIITTIWIHKQSKSCQCAFRKWNGSYPKD
uniref:Uncharacterized protein n=1 Tax=Ditylenchus dipsaci TaxID=166011 RepID=A0A915DH67_9BILA